ncbi:mitochondrial fission process protein 1-like [Saccoglossus kowalevskii]|uniref:Mitochondrial fission process protein 1 n=1 Tax=Saccoglossus kowalevskii TaxID=10224 RepID=A0ABM0GWT7_SACKO|nr:PREDICTED: mitochondrial fission process protein 1-like [Saccoglossus kowalevskii]
MASQDCVSCTAAGTGTRPDKNNKICDNEVDIYRDTVVRYLGYANEVGESFRALVPVSLVRFSYLVASGYVVADSVDKGLKASRIQWKNNTTKKKKIVHAVGDSLVWQGLASVAIPGFTINRICALSLFILRKTTSLPVGVRKWTTTAIGLSAIPFIIKPIDRSVDYMMDSTLRKIYRIEEDEQVFVHHER